MKPVEIKGVLDVEHQIRVERWKNGEKGVDLVAPFYTHLDKEGRPCGILVNRGWMPWDLRLLRHDRIVNMMKVSGVLYRGDAKTKYSKANVPLRNMYTWLFSTPYNMYTWRFFLEKQKSLFFNTHTLPAP